MTDLFSIRAAIEKDMPYIDAYAYYEGMDNIPGIDGVYVAVNADDIPVGFVRVVYSEQYEGVSYINPIVTASTWRGYGVGAALLQKAESLSNEIRLVARGTSKAFYDHMGYSAIPWEQVELTITENCSECTMTDECRPCPMRKIIPSI